MLAPLTHRKPAWIVARGGACLRFGVRPNAFGNALGDSFVGMMQPTQGVGAYSAGDYTNEMDRQSDSAYSQQQSQPYYDQIVGAFDNPGAIDRTNDVMLAAGPGYSGMGSGSDHDRNVARMLNLANQPEAMGSEGWASDGPYRVEVNGVGWTSSKAMPTLSDGTQILQSTDPNDPRLQVELPIADGVGVPSVPGYGLIGAQSYPRMGSTSLYYTPNNTDSFAANSDALAAVSTGAAMSDDIQFNMRGTAGFSAVSTWDAYRRVDYKAKAIANSEAFMSQFREMPRTQMAQGQVIANNAFEARQALRTATQNTLSPGGKLVSMALETKYTFANRYAEYSSRIANTAPAGPPHPMDVYERIVDRSGASNKWVSKINGYTKVAGPIGMGLGLAGSAYAIAHAPAGQAGRVAAEEAGGFFGGLAGGVAATSAVGGLALGAAAVGLTVGAPVILVGGAIVGIAGALYVSGYGREAGSYYYNKFRWTQ